MGFWLDWMDGNAVILETLREAAEKKGSSTCGPTAKREGGGGKGRTTMEKELFLKL